jgi:hypothetical protein
MRFSEDLIFVSLLIGSTFVVVLYGMHSYTHRVTEARRENIECRLRLAVVGEGGQADRICGKLVDVQ